MKPLASPAQMDTSRTQQPISADPAPNNKAASYVPTKPNANIAQHNISWTIACQSASSALL
jgi:hypothetical protein